jgi:hypothetical protein
MATLKVLVVVMGVLIVVGTVTLGVLLAKKMGGAPAYIDRSLAIPEGARVTGIANAGNQLVLELAGPGETQSLLLVDPASWQVTGTIKLESAK